MISYDYAHRALIEKRGEIRYDIDRARKSLAEYLEELEATDEAIAKLERDREKYSSES